MGQTGQHCTHEQQIQGLPWLHSEFEATFSKNKNRREKCIGARKAQAFSLVALDQP